MRKNVREAVGSGVQFQYHVGIEEHLAYARRQAWVVSSNVVLGSLSDRLPLPRSCIFIHPIEGS